MVFQRFAYSSVDDWLPTAVILRLLMIAKVYAMMMMPEPGPSRAPLTKVTGMNQPVMLHTVHNLQ